MKESLSFLYSGSIINYDISIQEITNRMKKGNATYYACKGLMTFKLINKHTERKIYITIIRWTVTYTYETWTLSVGTLIINNSLVFERQKLRKIFCPIKCK